MKKLPPLALGLLLPVLVFADDEKEITMEDVPAGVKTAIEGFIEAEAKGATIEEIEVETEDGVTVYEFELKLDGEEIEVEIGADGKILEIETDDDDDDDDHEDDDDDE